jgi:hypothetical protein
MSSHILQTFSFLQSFCPTLVVLPQFSPELYHLSKEGETPGSIVTAFLLRLSGVPPGAYFFVFPFFAFKGEEFSG